jgi:SPOR domain
MTDTNACHSCRRVLWGLGSAIAFLAAISGDLVAGTSEIDSYDHAVTSQTKEDAVAFLRDFRSSHLVGDLIDSLRPEVARQVCDEIADDVSAARRACQEIETRSTANMPTAAEPVVATAVEDSESPALEEQNDMETRSSANMPTAAEPVMATAIEDPENPALLKEQNEIDTAPRTVDSMEQDRLAASAVRVQLLSTKSRSGTERDWHRLQAAYPDLLSNLDLEIAEVDLGPSKGVWYRGLVGPMTSREEASTFCGSFRAQNSHNQCIVADRQ